MATRLAVAGTALFMTSHSTQGTQLLRTNVQKVERANLATKDEEERLLFDTVLKKQATETVTIETRMATPPKDDNTKDFILVPKKDSHLIEKGISKSTRSAHQDPGAGLPDVLRSFISDRNTVPTPTVMPKTANSFVFLKWQMVPVMLQAHATTATPYASGKGAVAVILRAATRTEFTLKTTRAPLIVPAILPLE